MMDGDTYAILPTTIRPRKIQPGRRTIMVSVLLSLMLLVSQLMRALQLDHPPKITNVHILQSITSMSEEVEAPTCVKMHLGSSPYSVLPEHSSCQHLPAPRGLCSLIHKLFFTDKPPTCQHQTNVTFCSTESDQIYCRSPAVCLTLQHYVGVFEETEARLSWRKVEKNKLAGVVTAEVNKVDYYGFVFIKCSNSSFMMEDLGQPNYDEDYINLNLLSYNQLFLYPKKVVKGNSDMKGKVNINMVMVDSLSRSHFYRSLPKTVRILEGLYEGSHRSALDFQYLQAVKPRTYESLQALFSGYVNTTEIPFGTYDIPKKPLPVSDLFGLYKKKGYKTLWLEDLCWNWEWGLVKDLKVVNQTLTTPALWRKFKKALERANIDAVDVTLASCDILEFNGKKDPFHNIPAVCFNGKHHHEYLLQYLQLYQTSLKNVAPFISLTITDVAHDETGLRVQSLDDSLASYLKFASKLKNTITVLFSDHGSTYGKFIQSSPEAHIETFNPFMFMIIPWDVQDSLGDVQMRILKDNENRLISLIDVHSMLLELIQEEEKSANQEFLVKYVNSGGLMSSIPSTRTCNDLPLLQPNLCICRNFETTVEPSDIHMVLADFGIGVLNNLILEQHTRGGGKGFGSCRPLQALKIRKAREIHVSADMARYKLDVVVRGTPSNNNETQEIYFLTVEVGSTKNALRLVSYERMSLYGVFNSCRDKSVELKLCVCNIEANRRKGGLLSSLLLGSFFPSLNFLKKNPKTVADNQITDYLSSSILGTKAKIDTSYPAHNPCLFTLIHRFKSGIILMGANFCHSHHLLEVQVETENLSLSSENNPRFLLHAGDVKMLLGGIITNPKASWEWKYHANIQ